MTLDFPYLSANAFVSSVPNCPPAPITKILLIEGMFVPVKLVDSPKTSKQNSPLITGYFGLKLYYSITLKKL
jgi:hypothetical protein